MKLTSFASYCLHGCLAPLQARAWPPRRHQQHTDSQEPPSSYGPLARPGVRPSPQDCH